MAPDRAYSCSQFGHNRGLSPLGHVRFKKFSVRFVPPSGLSRWGNVPAHSTRTSKEKHGSTGTSPGSWPLRNISLLKRNIHSTGTSPGCGGCSDHALLIPIPRRRPCRAPGLQFSRRKTREKRGGKFFPFSWLSKWEPVNSRSLER